ncbi:MAG: four helix bundle protein [Acidobacteria bacterium]|nr:MAG: four helix bundle protein [Acidobacteriota bacterium]
MTKSFADEPASEIITKQLIRSATSTAANYRAAGQSRSHAEFRSRLATVLEEADECIHWLEFSRNAGLTQGPELERLHREAKELAAIFGASRRTAMQNARRHAAARKVSSAK